VKIQGLIAAGLLMVSAGAFAQGHEHPTEMSITEVHEATKIALDEYIASTPAHADNIYAFQGTVSGAEAKVKLFVKNGRETIKVIYNCHKHETLECHLQGE
jgi:hypothetical protein